MVSAKEEESIIMAFKCDDCGKPQRDRTQPHIIVAETREKIYPPRYGKIPGYRYSVCIDNSGEGHEIVKEVKICSKCLQRRRAA